MGLKSAGSRASRKPCSYYTNKKGGHELDLAPEKWEHITCKVTRRWSDIQFYYSNICSYIRVLMGVIAIVLIVCADSWKATIAFLIMTSVLLTEIDGFLARHFDQSTSMGPGLDWTSTLISQFAISTWASQVGVVGGLRTEFILFTILFTGVEIATALFDFATSCKGFYPARNMKNCPPFMIVDSWLTPVDGMYNSLGTAAWISNTVFPLCVLLGLPWYVQAFFFPLAGLYVWHEVAKLVFLIISWTDISCSREPGVDLIRRCKPFEIEMLTKTLTNVKSLCKAPEDGGDRVFWNNMYYEDKWQMDIPNKEEFMNFLQDMLKEMYPEKRHINSFGFINSPKNGKYCQDWHYDYSDGTSNLFIPMVDLTHRNATHFVRGKRTDLDRFPTQNFPDPHKMLELDGLESMQVCQTIGKAFSIVKLFPGGVMHRGIHNLEDYDRILFFISTNDLPIDWSLMDEGAYNSNHMARTKF